MQRTYRLPSSPACAWLEGMRVSQKISVILFSGNEGLDTHMNRAC